MDLGQRLSNFFQNRVARPVQQEVQQLPQQVAGFGQNLMKAAQPIVNNANYNLWHSPVGAGLINAQNFIQSPQSIGLPQVPQQFNPTVKIGGILPIQPVQIARDVINTPLSFGLNSISDMGQNIGRTISGQQLANYQNLKSPATKLGYQLSNLVNPGATGGYTPDMRPQEFLGNGADTIAAPFSLYGGGKVASIGKNAAENAAKHSLKWVVKNEALQGAKMGGIGGVLNGLSANKNEDLPTQLTRSAGEGALGVGVGGVLGGGAAGAGYAGGAIHNKLTSILKSKYGMDDKQASETLGRFARDEVGRFSGNKPDNRIPQGLNNNMGDPKYALIAADLRQQMHLPANYQEGKVNFDAKVGNPFKQVKAIHKEVPNIATDQIVQQPNQPDLSQQKDRGLVKSVMEAQNISLPTQGRTTGMYETKHNPQLMGEAHALLSEGASLDLKHVEHADQKVAATIQEAINLDKQGQHDAAANLFNNLSEHGTELGRGVQAFSLLDKMSPEAISLSAAGKIKAYNRTAGKKIPELNGDQQKLISDHVSRIQSLKPGRDKNIAINDLQNTINDFIPSTVVDKALTVWKAGLLTSLRTSERNILGNSFHAVAETAKDIPASIMDRIMSLRTGKRSLTFNTQGAASGAGKGLVAAKDMITKGYDPEESLTKFDQKRITWGKNPLEQALKFGTDVVFRSLGAQDKPFLHSAISRSLHDQAKAAAINAGKSGDSKFIQELVSNPTPEMAKIAMKDAETLTFKNKNVMSDIINSAKRAAQNPKYGKGAELGKVITEGVAPFTGVPSSIGGQLVAYSPIGLAKGIAKAGTVLAKNVPDLQRQAAQEVGRGVIGTGLVGVGAYLSSKGLMTGQPKDANQQAQWQLGNKPANSVFIDGKWRAIGSIGPENLVILAGAKAQEELSKPEGSLGTYSANLGKDFLGQTFLQGVQQPLAAITDPARYGQSYLGNQAASAIPNIVKDAAKSQDPSARENNSIGDYITNSIPGLRNQNVEKRDNLGNVIPQEPTGAGAFFDLFNSKTPVSNPVVDELGRLDTSGNNAVPNKLGKSQTINGEKVKLTPQQLNTLESQVGPQATDSIKQLMQTPDYQALSDEEKAKAIDSIVTQVRKQVRGNIDLSNGTTNPLPNNGQQYTLITDTGTVKRIDLSKGITQPQLTGLVELDKKINAKYNSELNARQNDILSLYQAGKIDAKLAESKIEDLKSQHTTTGKGRKASIKKNFLSAVPKFKPISFSKSKMTSVKTPRGKSVKRFSLSKPSFKPTTKSKKTV